MRGQQSVFGQALHDRREHVVALEIELRPRDAPPRDDPVVAARHEPEEEAVDGRALRLGQVLVRSFGEPRDRPTDAAEPLVRLEPKPSVPARHPELDERRREQRQPARLVRDLVDERLRECRLDAHAGAAGRQLDRSAKLVRAHRPNQHLVRGNEAREGRVRAAVTVVVAAQADHHDGAPRIGRDRDEALDEPLAHVLVVTRRENLLELVDGQNEPLLLLCVHTHRVEFLERVRAGPYDRGPPAFAPGKQACAQGWKQPGRDHRGLAAARRADDREQAGSDRPGR